MSHSFYPTSQPFPDNIEDCAGNVIKIKSDADEASKEAFGEDQYYVFLLSSEAGLLNNQNTRIRLIPLNQLNRRRKQPHTLATLMGYELIKNLFTVNGVADITSVNI